MIHVNEIKLSGDDDFSKSFNKLSELWAKSEDESLTEEERKRAWKEYCQRKIALEMGY